MPIIATDYRKSPWGKYDTILGGLILLNILFLAPVAIGAVFGFGFTAFIYMVYLFMFLLFCMMNPCM